MVALIGAANATSSSFTSLNAFLIQAVGTSSALNSSQSVAALGNFTTFVQASIGAAGNSTALTLAANSFNGFIVTNVGLSNITTIASYIQSLVGASNATTATINYIQTAFPGLANGTNLINYINANPGSSNATAANWINFLYTNCGPSSTSNLIQFNSLIQLAIGFKPIPTPSPVLQQLSSYPSTVDNTLLNNNLNLFLSYLMQIQTTQLVSIGFVSGVSLSTINYMPMLAYPGTSNYLVGKRKRE